MSDEIKNLLQKQGEAFEAFKASLADEGKSKTADSEAKTARINDELTRLAKEIKTSNDRAEAAEAAAARPNRGDGRASPCGTPLAPGGENVAGCGAMGRNSSRCSARPA